MATKDISDIQVINAYIQSRQSNFDEWPYDLLQRTTGQPVKVCYRAMERAASRGFIDYGISLRTGWVTDKGMALLNQQRQRDNDEQRV